MAQTACIDRTEALANFDNAFKNNDFVLWRNTIKIRKARIVIFFACEYLASRSKKFVDDGKGFNLNDIQQYTIAQCSGYTAGQSEQTLFRWSKKLMRYKDQLNEHGFDYPMSLVTGETAPGCMNKQEPSF